MPIHTPAEQDADERLQQRLAESEVPPPARVTRTAGQVCAVWPTRGITVTLVLNPGMPR